MNETAQTHSEILVWTGLKEMWTFMCAQLQNSSIKFINMTVSKYIKSILEATKQIMWKMSLNQD